MKYKSLKLARWIVQTGAASQYCAGSFCRLALRWPSLNVTIRNPRLRLVGLDSTYCLEAKWREA